MTLMTLMTLCEVDTTEIRLMVRSVLEQRFQSISVGKKEGVPRRGERGIWRKPAAECTDFRGKRLGHTNRAYQ